MIVLNFDMHLQTNRFFEHFYFCLKQQQNLKDFKRNFLLKIPNKITKELYWIANVQLTIAGTQSSV